MRSILVHIHNDPCLESRLQVALDLARAFGGHVTCQQVTPFDFVVPGDMYGTLAAEVLPVLRKNDEQLRVELAARLEREDVNWDFRHEDGLAIDTLLRAGALNDLVVLGASDPTTNGKGPSWLAGEFAIKGRTPVVVVPQDARGLNVAGPAIVAWNGSPEAAHALRAALPLLAKARSVTLARVTEAEDREGEISAVEGAEYLSRHGIECEIVELPRERASTGEVLARAAAAREAAYLVMGAYGHARLVETVWGGVTRELFADPPLPIVACH